jgi:hypothetical protein
LRDGECDQRDDKKGNEDGADKPAQQIKATRMRLCAEYDPGQHRSKVKRLG